MPFKSRFYYTDGANEGGGAPDAGAAVLPPVIPDEIQKELTELRAFKEQIASKEPDKTPEQLAKLAEIEQADFIKYSVENDLLKVEDLTRYESLKVKADRDLVFENYLAEWKSENPDVKDEKEIEEKSKEDFESEYRLNSDNDKLKAKGIARLAKEAKEFKSPLETSYTKAKEKFTEDKTIQSKIPEFNTLIDGIIKESTPEKIVVKTKDGDQEIDVEVELTKEQKAEIEKIFKSPKVFGNYYNSDEAEKGGFKEKVQKKIEGFIKANTFDAAVAKGFETGKGIGIKQGSNIGANNPFALNDGKKQEAKVITLEESNAKVAAEREKRGR